MFFNMAKIMDDIKNKYCSKHFILKYNFLILFLVLSLINSWKIFPQTKSDSSKIKIPLSLMGKTIPAEIDPLKTEINYPILYGVGGVTLATGIAVHIYQKNAWWQQNGSRFRVINDWTYALWIDKLGHFFGTHLIAHGLSAGLEATNVDLERSAIYSSIGALAFELFIEIEDGFGPQWGFSPGDATADILGASYALGQYYFPVLKNIQPRVSYYPSKEFREGKHKGGLIVDDYSGQKYWFAFRMKELLPKKVAKFWPSFLMLSVGMGISNWNHYGGGNNDFYIAFDFDAETIPLYGKTWQFIKNTLNYIHFPMPGIRITPNTAAFVFVF